MLSLAMLPELSLALPGSFSWHRAVASASSLSHPAPAPAELPQLIVHIIWSQESKGALALI